MNHPLLILALVLCASPDLAAVGNAAAPAKPNIVYILADDLGYGDVHCLNPERGKIATPNIDRLAASGMTFTDAHSTSAVCTPSRYSILTGRYNWRTQLQQGVLNGTSLPLIAADRLTVPALLKQHGYATACIGKWHLGMRMPQPITKGAIKSGPTTRGFDYFFGISASLDMPPYAFIENDRFTESPTDTKAFKRRGPAAPDFEPVDVLPTLVDKSVQWIERHKDQPFFLYLPLNSPHTPLAPTSEWLGKSGLGLYGDFVMQTDWAVGQVVKAVDAAGIIDNTLIILTSDNGCAPYIGVDKLEGKGHFPSANLRGYKADAWDGGHRVPYIVQWSGTVKPGSTCAQLVGQNDLMATCAELVGATLPDSAGEDSVSFLPLLKGSQAPIRTEQVHHSIRGKFAIRQGDWKLLLCPGSGGWGSPRDEAALKQKMPAVQLYDMRQDVGEQRNMQAEYSTKVEALTARLEKIVADGRSTPGPKQANDVRVKIEK